MPRPMKPADGAAGAANPPRAPKRGVGAHQRGNGSADAVNDAEAIARRAYEIYQRRGGSHGADLDDWLQAERELKRGPTDVTGLAPSRPRKRKAPAGTGL